MVRTQCALERFSGFGRYQNYAVLGKCVNILSYMEDSSNQGLLPYLFTPGTLKVRNADASFMYVCLYACMYVCMPYAHVRTIWRVSYWYYVDLQRCSSRVLTFSLGGASLPVPGYFLITTFHFRNVHLTIVTYLVTPRAPIYLLTSFQSSNSVQCAI